MKGKNVPAGTQFLWHIPAGEVGKYTLTQHVTSSGISEVEISGIRPGRAKIGIAAIDGGVRIQSQIHELSIPQFVTVDDKTTLFDTFITSNNLQAIRDPIIEEANRVIDLLFLSEANVRLLWSSTGATVPAHIPATFVTTASIRNTDPTGDYGQANPGPTVPGAVGDTVFDERVVLFPGNYLTSLVSPDANQAVNDLVKIIQGIQASDPDLEIWLIRFFGRLLGETMSHELYHTLLPVPFSHNVDGSGNNIDTGDIMDLGSCRSFLERTGIGAASTTPADFIANLTDNTITAINKLTGRSLKHVRDNFTVPPVPPFDK